MSVLKNLYKCNFCRIGYEVLPFSILRFADKLIAFTGMRLYQCPHCFGCTRLPWIPFRRTGAEKRVHAEVHLDRDSDGDCGPVVLPLIRHEVCELVHETV